MLIVILFLLRFPECFFIVSDTGECAWDSIRTKLARALGNFITRIKCMPYVSATCPDYFLKFPGRLQSSILANSKGRLI